jgi:hypothetical protein
VSEFDAGLSRLLLTVTAIGYGFLPLLADFNRTHATNPLWTGHARFHVVWQCLSYLGISLIALALLWASASPSVSAQWVVVALGYAVYLGFFATRLSIRLYGGSSYDDNGYLPLDLGPIRVEPNTLLFSVMVLLHTVAALLITGAG